MVASNRLFDEFPCLCVDNLKLRELSSSDCNEMYEIYSNEDNAAYITSKIHSNVEKTKNMIAKVLDECSNGSSAYWVITSIDTDKLMGFVAIHKIDYVNHVAMIGYVLNKKYWGQGIAAKSIAKVSEFVLRETLVSRIEATIKPQNMRSIKCIEKAGFAFVCKITNYASDAKEDSNRERLLYVKEI